ncbi:hypothetical protein [Agrobacterium tumefaciens]|uniref:hypothetical protein n=1 Tax=Agrobacterium tumefaciens TaxID=358 RepID=UPI00287BF10F|nr:hypothetical protein [Agrobacterium tumefaciens]MDS7597774.1 hypothetical protein [Agrobacterium tumefaciens]
MSFNSRPSAEELERLDTALADAGMRNFSNATEQSIRMRAARHLIAQFLKDCEELPSS